MKVNLYDFDGTIYDGNSAIDIFIFCIKKNKKCLLVLPKLIKDYFLYYLGKKNKTEVKSTYFSFVKYFDNIDSVIRDFWYLNNYKIKKFYLEKDHKNDIIISATPEILLSPICKELEVKDLIGSVMDKNSGKFLRNNCKGKEKVIRLKEKYPKAKVLESYSDSFSDQPIFDLADKAYLVKKDRIIKLK